MNIKDYITPLLRWWWLLLVATILAVVSSFLATFRQPEVYRAHATLMVGRMINEPNPNSNEYYLAQQLASTYANIGNREQVRAATMKSLGISWMPEYLVQAMPNSPLIDIQVTDTSPQVAQAVANELANQMILLSPGSDQAGGTDQQAFIEQQLEILQKQITDTQAEIEMLQQQLGELNSARQITDMQTQITAQESKLSTLQANYASLLAGTSSGASNTLTIIEQAELPVNPTGPSKLLIVALAGSIGLVLAALGAYLIEYLDDTIQAFDDTQKLFNLPTIAKIGRIDADKNDNKLIALESPMSPVVDSFRMLRMNIQAIANWQSLHTILFTSAEPSVGKSTTIANLAIVMAQFGKRVILVDADVRKPAIHKLFGVSNEIGLMDLIVIPDLSVMSCLKGTKIEKLKILTSGSLEVNSIESLGSERMRSVIKELSSLADYVLLDSSPAMMFSDPYLIGKLVNGVIIVSRVGQTRKELVKRVESDLRLAGINLVGVVIQHRKNSEPYGYQYYRQYYKSKEEGR